MRPLTLKQLLGIQSIILFAGAAFAWSKLIPQLVIFSPNPFLTACFYGSSAFLIVLFWSVRVYQTPNERSERWLSYLLLFCVVFAASVVAYEAVEYYHLFGPPTSAFICAPGVPPTKTPCFIGMIFFMIAFGVSCFATYRMKSVPR